MALALGVFDSRALSDAHEITLAWTPNTETNIAGYIVYYGICAGVYTNLTNVGNVTSAKLAGLSVDATYYFAVTAYNASGNESPPSNELVYRAFPGTNRQARLSPLTWHPRGGFCLQGLGAARRHYFIEATANLRTGTWERIAEVPTGVTGTVSYMLTDFFGSPSRFYRAVLNPAPALMIGINSDGLLRIRGFGDPSTTYDIEACTDVSFGDWNVVSSVLTDGKGEFSFVVAASQNPSRFYRAVLR